MDDCFSDLPLQILNGSGLRHFIMHLLVCFHHLLSLGEDTVFMLIRSVQSGRITKST